MTKKYSDPEIMDLRVSGGPYGAIIGYTGYIGVMPGDRVAVTAWEFNYRGPGINAWVCWGIKKTGDWPTDLLDNLVASYQIGIMENMTADFLHRTGTSNAVMVIPASITTLSQQIGVHYWISPKAPVAGVPLTLADRISVVGIGDDVLRVIMTSELNSLNVKIEKVV